MRQPSASKAVASQVEREHEAWVLVKSAPAPENWSETGPRAWSWGWWEGQGAVFWICQAGYWVSVGKSYERAEAEMDDLVTSQGPEAVSREATGARPPGGCPG